MKFQLKQISGLWWLRIWLGVLGVTLAGCLIIILLFAYLASSLPSPDRIVRREGFATRIYDRNGKLIYDLFADQRRNPVDIALVPNYLKQATIAIEDKNFYKHNGLDPLAPFRIMWNALVYRRIIGGSGLTQQLVKNALLTPERNLVRKLKELILTLQIEQRYSKEQILQMYLNEVPYGGTAWGVQSAAEMYFGKPVSLLNLPESAILAGLPQSPSAYSPFRSNLYIERAIEVLRRMREDGYITRDEELAAKAAVPTTLIATSSGTLKAPHFVFYVKQKLEEMFGEHLVEQGGLRVTTSLDLDLQEVAQKAVAEEIAKVKSLKIGNGASVVMDPKTGEILAMVGSKGWEANDYDGKWNVALANRQPGSSIKPLVYLAGLQQGFTPASLFMDVKTEFPGGKNKPSYVPENYDAKFRGPILMREALGNSINVPAVKMLALVGVEKTLRLGYGMGLSTLEPTPDNLSRLGLSMALGGGEVKLLELVNAYSAFANGGQKVPIVSILEVVNVDNKVLYSKPNIEPKNVMTKGEAFLVSSMLADPKAREITFGTNSALTIPNKTVAVKTGTTNDKRDNWTIGWTPSVIIGVWVGNNDNTPMRDVASGVTGASPIWRRIITYILKDKKDEPFNQPEEIEMANVDKITGFNPVDGKDTKNEFFIKGTRPLGDNAVHRLLRLCNGELKNFFFFKEDDPYMANGINKWQEAINDWVKLQSEPSYHYDQQSQCGNQVWITIKEPQDKTRINGNDVKIAFDVSGPYEIKKTSFYTDGTLRQTLDKQPWEVTVSLADGYHKIDVSAEDEKGNIGTRYVEISVNRDYEAPTPTP